MTIYLYSIKEDRRKVTKITVATVPIDTLSAHCKADVNVLDPVLEVANSANLPNCDYFYVPDWNRYYFVTGLTVGAQRCYLSGHVDVLQSYESDIRKIVAVIERQQSKSKGQLYMSDKMFKSEARKVIQIKKFNRQFNKGASSYVLATGGKS